MTANQVLTMSHRHTTMWITGSEPPKLVSHFPGPGAAGQSRVETFLLAGKPTKNQIPFVGVRTDESIYFLSAARAYTMTRRGLRSCVTADFRDAHRGRV